MATQLKKIIRNLETIDENGNKIVLKNIPMLQDKDNETWVRIEDIIKAQRKKRRVKNGLQ